MYARMLCVCFYLNTCTYLVCFSCINSCCQCEQRLLFRWSTFSFDLKLIRSILHMGISPHSAHFDTHTHTLSERSEWGKKTEANGRVVVVWDTRETTGKKCLENNNRFGPNAIYLCTISFIEIRLCLQTLYEHMLAYI